jgi:polyisoprenoid-binding protein YceI
MSHRVVKPRARRLQRWLCLLGLPLATAVFSSSVYAACEYKIASQWDGGFTASIAITNSTSAPITNWSISWQYASANRMSNGWNANYSGTNPYTASNLNWNGALQPGQSIEIGLQGTKGTATAEIPTIAGSVCGVAAASSSSVAVSSSSVATSSSSVAISSSSSSVATSASSSSVSSAVSNQVAWDLDETVSFLNFTTTKNVSTVETHFFTSMSGQINSSGVASVTLDLNTVSTGIPTRNQRVRDFLFETATYPTATFSVNVPSSLLSTLSAGQITQTDLTANVDLHGVIVPITARVSVQRLSDTRILVQTMSPILTRAADFNLTDGIEILRTLASLSSLSGAVAVDFALVFDAR